MHFATTVTTLLAAGLAAAQSRRAAGPCPAQNILDVCLATETPLLQGCEPNDWSCLCNQSNNVLTCYNNCPGADGQFGAQQTMTSYCNAAKAYSSTSSSSSSSFATAIRSAAPSESSSSTASSTDSASGSEPTESGSLGGSGSGSSTLSHSSSSSSASASLSTSSNSAGAASVMVDGLVMQGGIVAALVLGFGMGL